MKNTISLDIEKVYDLFSQTYTAYKEIIKADYDDEVFGIKGMKAQFCGNWSTICLLGLEDEYYKWKKLCGFDKETGE